MSAAFLGLGYATELRGNSPDERLGSVVPYLIGLALLAIDGLMLVGYVLMRVFA